MTKEELTAIRERWAIHRNETGAIVGGYMGKEEFPIHALVDIHALLDEIDRLTRLLLDAGRCTACGRITKVVDMTTRKCVEDECGEEVNLLDYGYGKKE